MIEQWALHLSSTPWIVVVMYLFATVDGFFPPIPSESVIIALTTLSVTTGHPALLPIVVAAAAGAFTGDQIAYQIGRSVKVRQLRWMRSAKAQHALDWAEHTLQHRAAAFIIAARYIPVGRVAVNMSAGTLGFPRRRFMALTGIAAVTWSAYSVLLGVGAGHLLHDHPMLAVVVGVAGGALLGVGIDWVLRRWTSSRGGSAPAEVLPGDEDEVPEPVTRPTPLR